MRKPGQSFHDLSVARGELMVNGFLAGEIILEQLAPSSK